MRSSAGVALLASAVLLHPVPLTAGAQEAPGGDATHPFSDPAAAAQDAPDADVVMERAGERYRAIESFCAYFRQRLEVPLLDRVTETEGTLCQAQPNLFAMRFSSPGGDLLVADGRFFWVYYPSADPGQVLQFPMEVRPGGVDFHREFLEDAPEKYELSYEGRDTLNGAAVDIIRAKPLGRAGFNEARLWLDRERSLILRARIGMENGSVRTVTLSEIRLNPPPDPARFTFDPPPGVQVIRRR